MWKIGLFLDMQVERGRAGSELGVGSCSCGGRDQRPPARLLPHSQALNPALGVFHACWNPFSLLPDENPSFPSGVRIFFTAASSWLAAGIRREHTQLVGLLVGWKEGESFPATEQPWGL